MKKIAFVVVWMGKLPEYFKLWERSCEANPTIDFFVFTDDRYEDKTADNVKIYNMSFEKVKERFQRIFDFPVNLERAYKLCDYKPVYGEAFHDYLAPYEYWGYCDIDLIWGNIRHFLPDEILEKK